MKINESNSMEINKIDNKNRTKARPKLHFHADYNLYSSIGEIHRNVGHT